MHFYLGSHVPAWLATSSVPLFVSHHRLENLKTLPVAQTNWALDSGGFTEIKDHGKWRATARQYVGYVRRYVDEIGRIDFAAPQDWMCEPAMVARTGLTVRDHQLRTARNFVDLRLLDPTIPFIPVLQGYSRDDYLRNIDDYLAAGIDLKAEPRVGVGSVCRRQHSKEIEALFEELRKEDLRLHAFGVKTQGLRAYGDLVASSDSLAWSLAASKTRPLPGHEALHGSCSNCMDYAMQWRDTVLENAVTRQPRIGTRSVERSEEQMNYPADDQRVSAGVATRPGVHAPRKSAPRERRATPATLEPVRVGISTPPVLAVFDDAGKNLGELQRTVGGQYRAVPMSGRVAPSSTHPDLMSAAASAGWALDSSEPSSSHWSGPIESGVAEACVRLTNGTILFTLFECEQWVIGPRLFRRPDDARAEFARQGSDFFLTDEKSLRPGSSVVDVYVKAYGGFWFNTRASGNEIVGARYAGDVEVDGDVPDPAFVADAQLQQRNDQRSPILFGI